MRDSACLAEVIAIIPCYNEQDRIYDVVTEASKHVGRVIVIDDGSEDNTAEIAMKAGAQVIKHHRNLGKGEALETAFTYLRTCSCRAAVLLDGDGQHNPAEIPDILQPVLAGDADMVIGSRFIEGADKIPFYRKVGQVVLNLTTNLGSNIWVTDSQSGFRAFSDQAIMQMTFNEKGFSVESEMQFIASKQSLNVIEVPISTIYDGKLKRNPAVHGFSVLLRIIKLSLASACSSRTAIAGKMRKT